MILDETHSAADTTVEAPTSLAVGWRGIWASARAVLGTLLGLIPHLMHHVGLIAGAALLTGVIGNSVLYALGLILSIPLLRRLRRRFNSWKPPILGVAIFTVLFSVSALVGGLLINPAGPQSPLPSETSDHTGHHP